MNSIIWLVGAVVIVLFVAGFLTLFGGMPNYNNNDPLTKVDTLVRDAYTSSGKRAAVVIGAYLIVLSALALLWFVAAMRTRMRRLGVGDTTRDLTFAAGVMSAVLIAGGGGAFATVAGGKVFGSEPNIPSDDVVRVIPQIGYPLLMIGGMLAVAVVIAIVSVLALRVRLLPRWLGYAGWLAVLGAVFAVEFIPMVLVALWFLAVGIVAAVGRLPEPGATPSPEMEAPARQQSDGRVITA